jgi:uncharacterized membrane protein YbhN (UPF0104 family)
LLKTALKWLLSILIGAIFVWYAARNWPLQRVFEGTPQVHGTHFAMVPDGLTLPEPFDEGARALLVAEGGWTLDLMFLLPFFALLTAVHFLRVWRWDVLLKPLARFSFGELNRVGAVGFMAMFIFPFRLGELVRPYLLRERNPGKIRMTSGLAVIVVERTMDGVVVSFLLFLVLAFMPQTHIESYERVRIGTYAALVVFLGIIAVLGALFWLRDRVSAAAERFPVLRSTALGQRLLGMLKAFLEALRVIPNYRSFLFFTLLTAFYWWVVGVGYNVLAHGFDLPVPLIGSYAMMATSVVGMMIPNSPANVGSFWVFFLLPLEVYMGPQARSTQVIAYALVAWGVTVIQYLVFAGWFLLRRKVSFQSAVHPHVIDADG